MRVICGVSDITRLKNERIKIGVVELQRISKNALRFGKIVTATQTLILKNYLFFGFSHPEPCTYAWIRCDEQFVNKNGS